MISWRAFCARNANTVVAINARKTPTPENLDVNGAGDATTAHHAHAKTRMICRRCPGGIWAAWINRANYQAI